MDRITVLDRDNLVFPPITHALREPDGLLAAGGDLSVARLTAAYSHGVFPWFEDGQPILWWSPDPRVVMFPDQFKISRSLGKLLRQGRFEVTLDQAFDAVIDACGNPRSYSRDTWITAEMKDAYKALHRAGLAHSIECYAEGELVGGLYGVALGKLFFGESMFHVQRDASKVAFAYLVRMMKAHGCPLIDCQISNPHLTSLGATTISRDQFSAYLDRYLNDKLPIDWQALPRRLAPW